VHAKNAKTKLQIGAASHKELFISTDPPQKQHSGSETKWAYPEWIVALWNLEQTVIGTDYRLVWHTW